MDLGEKQCRNPLCSRADRYFQWNFSIAMRSGALKRAINAYKYEGASGWALIFGRILVGFLDRRTTSFESFDLIVASPTFVGEGSRNFDHTRRVLEKAAAEAPPGKSWPFDLATPPAIIKTGPTEPLTGKTYQQRRDIAEGPFRDALLVPDPGRTRGLTILVYDDVFTDGRTLDEVARSLRLQGGAQAVCGVTLCRQPWRGRA
ncbi:MAG: ComF family protein [Candidatus Dormiibacterota bacterium]